MYNPPSDPPDRPGLQPTWQRIVAGYALIAAMFLLLWAISQPLAAMLVLLTLAAVTVAARRTARLARCVVHCQELTIRLAGTVRITISQINSEPAK